MTHVHKLTLETFVWGLYIVQPAYDEAEFAGLTADLPASNTSEYQDAYKELKGCKGGCICKNEQTPWVIVALSGDPRQIRRTTLHEIVHLSDKLVYGHSETRARFIEHVYFALTDTLPS